MITVDQDELGYKYQMSDIEACFGLAALKEVDEWLDHRHRLARRYRANLAGVAGLAVVETDSPRKRSSHSLFGILVEERDNFCSALESRGVETNVVQLRNDIYTVFGGQRQALPGMNEVEPRYLYLPIHGQLTLEDVDEICHHIGEGW